MAESFKQRAQKLTSYGEPLWVDVLKTLGVAASVLAAVFIVGFLLVVAIVSPWARESYDCSVWCVMERDVREFIGLVE
jgi:ABC-type amino acid transport system permease subunit